MNYRTLISTEELARHLDDPAWVIFDCRFILSDPEAGRRAYAAGHIPGARYAHLNDDLSGPVSPNTGRHPLPDPDVLAEKLGRWGVDETRQVIAYDDSYGAIAARLWWLLRWLGHEAVAVLDGDLRAWLRENRPLTTTEPAVAPRAFTPRLRPNAWVESADVERLIETGDGILIDARAEERFRGEVEPFDRVAGHVPGALSLPFEDNLQPSGRFLPPEELRDLYGQLLGDIPSSRVVHMCGSGVTACHNLLAMEHAGLPGARLYAGSWSEWITDPRRPIARGD